MSYITHIFKLYGLQSRLTLQCFPCACWLVVGPGWGKNGDYWMVGYCLDHHRGSQQWSWLQMTGWIDNSPTWWFVPLIFLKKIIESPYDYLFGSCHLMSLCMSPIWMRNSTAHAKKLNMCVCVGQMIEQWNLHKVHQSSAKMHVDFLQLQMFETSFDLQCLAACATMSKQGSDQEWLEILLEFKDRGCFTFDNFCPQSCNREKILLFR